MGILHLQLDVTTKAMMPHCVLFLNKIHRRLSYKLYDFYSDYFEENYLRLLSTLVAGKIIFTCLRAKSNLIINDKEKSLIMLFSITSH